MLSFDEFQNVDMRVGLVESAEPVEGSEKLMRLIVDLGDELGERQIVAGIAKTHSPEDIEGRQVVVLTNLEPKKLMGVESQGMVLAASPESGPVLIMPENEVAPGTKIR